MFLKTCPCGSDTRQSLRQVRQPAHAGRELRFRVLAAKQRAQGGKQAAKQTKQPRRAQGGRGNSSVQPKQAETSQQSSDPSTRNFVQQNRTLQEFSSPPDKAASEAFEARLSQLKERSAALRSQAQALVTGEEGTDDAARHQASTSSRTDSDNSSAQPSFWGQAAVGFGAVALVAVFVFATVGVDLGLGGRRGPTPSPGQVSAFSPEEEKRLRDQAAKFEQQAEADTSSTDALAGAASTYAALGDLDKSAALLQQLTAAAPKDVSAWQALGEIQLQQNKPHDAVLSYERAVSESPADTVTLLQGLGRALGADNRYQEAVDQLIAVRKRADADASASVGPYEAGMLLAKTYAAWPRHTADALAVYDDLIKHYDQDYRAFLAKGLVLKSAGKVSDAQRSFLQARYLAPPEARRAVDDLAER
ncbi:hypothetical protein WJX73_002585 [Symbiochloris irregularis]|uniref:Tetratricopeptide repeat protein n=1 Tax=Symbiochloris irregularis TaxID=706552 RepID=A0AAW1NRU2_9CHLO